MIREMWWKFAGVFVIGYMICRYGIEGTRKRLDAEKKALMRIRFRVAQDGLNKARARVAQLKKELGES